MTNKLDTFIVLLESRQTGKEDLFLEFLSIDKISKINKTKKKKLIKHFFSCSGDYSSSLLDLIMCFHYRINMKPCEK